MKYPKKKPGNAAKNDRSRATKRKAGAARKAKADPPDLILAELQTVEGFVSRVLIGEPSFDNTRDDWPEQRACMTALAALLYNRIHQIPARYRQQEIANVTTTDLREVLAAPGQFRNFGKDASGRFTIAPAYRQMVDDRVIFANQPPRKEGYATVAHAIALARRLARGTFDPDLDPFRAVTTVGGIAATGRAYGMRTENSGSPGGDYLDVPVGQNGTLAGNSFFTLRVRR